jgi:hypothetical protein
VGTDYCDALGTYDSLAAAEDDAMTYAWDHWEEPEESDFEDEGPDYFIEEYDPEKHDRLKAGGGSFEGEFAHWEKEVAFRDDLAKNNR